MNVKELKKEEDTYDGFGDWLIVLTWGLTLALAVYFCFNNLEVKNFLSNILTISSKAI